MSKKTIPKFSDSTKFVMKVQAQSDMLTDFSAVACMMASLKVDQLHLLISLWV